MVFNRADGQLAQGIITIWSYLQTLFHILHFLNLRKIIDTTPYSPLFLYFILHTFKRTALLYLGKQSFIFSYYSVLIVKLCSIPLSEAVIILRS